jgi:hypothetical protein
MDQKSEYPVLDLTLSIPVYGDTFSLHQDLGSVDLSYTNAREKKPDSVSSVLGPHKCRSPMCAPVPCQSFTGVMSLPCQARLVFSIQL